MPTRFSVGMIPDWFLLTTVLLLALIALCLMIIAARLVAPATAGRRATPTPWVPLASDQPPPLWPSRRKQRLS